MQQEIYDAMYKLETTHWWFRAKQDIVEALLDMHLPPHTATTPLRLLDVGCGCGLMLRSLQSRGEVVGMDFSQTAIDYCRSFFPGSLCQWDLNQPYIFHEGFDGIVALDVLEHIQRDDVAMQNIAAGLNPGGVAVLTVPAHPWMWSVHDEACMHQRRYTKSSLQALCQSSGLEILYLSYYNCGLFPVVAIVRLLEKLTGGRDRKHSPENRMPPECLNRLLYRIFARELRPISQEKPLPWGVLLIAILKRPPSFQEGGC